MAHHTFATTVTLNNGIPIETISILLGYNEISNLKQSLSTKQLN